MAIIEHIFPDPDDPIFSGAFTVIFPTNFQPQEGSMAKRLPYEHSPEPGEGEQPWTIHIDLRPKPDSGSKKPPKPSAPSSKEEGSAARHATRPDRGASRGQRP